MANQNSTEGVSVNCEFLMREARRDSRMALKSHWPHRPGWVTPAPAPISEGLRARVRNPSGGANPPLVHDTDAILPWADMVGLSLATIPASHLVCGRSLALRWGSAPKGPRLPHGERPSQRGQRDTLRSGVDGHAQAQIEGAVVWQESSALPTSRYQARPAHWIHNDRLKVNVSGGVEAMLLAIARHRPTPPRLSPPHRFGKVGIRPLVQPTSGEAKKNTMRSPHCAGRSTRHLLGVVRRIGRVVGDSRWPKMASSSAPSIKPEVPGP